MRDHEAQRARTGLRRAGAALLAVGACLGLQPQAAAADADPGDVDESFGTQGRVALRLAEGDGGDRPQDLVVQEDGKLVVGLELTSDGPYPKESVGYAVARLLPDGGLDPAFGEDGVFRVGYDDLGVDALRGLALAPDGDVVVAGESDEDFVVIRLSPSGVLEPSFGDGGVARIPLPDAMLIFGAEVATDPGGSLVVAGSVWLDGSPGWDFAFARIEPDGEPDPGFGSGAPVVVPVGEGGSANHDLLSALAVSAEGGIFGAGDHTRGGEFIPSLAIARLRFDGSPDPTFGGDGTVVTALDENASARAAIPAGGGLIVGGYGQDDGPSGGLLARYRSDGELDPAFGGDPRPGIAILPEVNTIRDVAPRPGAEGLYFGGEGYSPHFAVGRTDASGALEPGFGTDGITRIDLSDEPPSHGGEGLSTVATQPNGDVVFAGRGTEQGPTGYDGYVFRVYAEATPRTTITGAPATPTANAQPAFSFESDASGATFTCSLDGGVAAGCTSPWQVGPLDDGEHWIGVAATVNGRTDPTPATYPFTVDTVAPGAPVLTRAPGSPTNETSAGFEFTGEPGGSWACLLDDDPVGACSPAGTELSALADGLHTFSVAQTDDAGNESPRAVHQWTVDTVPPDTRVRPRKQRIRGRRAELELRAAGEPELTTFRCRAPTTRNPDWRECTSPWRTPRLRDGKNRLKVRAVDTAGNHDETAARAYVRVG